MALPSKDVFSHFDEVTERLHLNEEGQVFIRYPAPRRVGNVTHLVCGGAVDEIGRTDFAEEKDIGPVWVEDWKCRRCGQMLQGSDCKIAYTG
jgi:hypothetical protein